MDAAADQNLHSRAAMFVDGLAGAVECGDAVPFVVLNPVAVFVADDLTFRWQGREVARVKWVILVPPWVERVSEV